jgi:hypothetical protein
MGVNDNFDIDNMFFVINKNGHFAINGLQLSESTYI